MVSTVFYMKVELSPPIDPWYVVVVAIVSLLTIMITELAYMWRLKHEFPYNLG